MEEFIVLLGMLMASATVLALLMRYLKQSPILAFIALGVIAGFFRNQVHLPEGILEAFTETGIVLLLFMAGMEVEFDSFRKRWKLLLSNGLGQIIITALLGVLLGSVLLNQDRPASIIYFGLCLTFSSTIVVIGYLKLHRQMESLHGQIILGLMVLQDIIAILAIVVLGSIASEESLLLSIGMLLAKMIIIGGVIAVLSRYVLKPLFYHLAKNKELLFVGSLGWALGVAAACEAVHFSAEIGAFMAGAALSFLPYKLAIQSDVEPIKDFGVILFFVVLGYRLDLAAAASLIAPILSISLLMIIGTPLIMMAIGYFTRESSRCSFMVGGIINQISEFSLILATLCLYQGIFNDRTFTIIAFSTVATISLSSIGHQFLDRIYSLIGSRLAPILDSRMRALRMSELEGFTLNNHYIILKYNELAEEFVSAALQLGRRVLVIDIDPDIYTGLKDRHENLTCLYADIYDPDTWEDAAFADAAGIVSCVIAAQTAELAILEWLRQNRLETPFIASTDILAEALELYEQGATFVIQTEQLAGERVRELLRRHGMDLTALDSYGLVHWEKLKDSRDKMLFRYA